MPKAKEVVVVLPGIMGSVLETPQKVQVWPPPDCRTLAGHFTDAQVDEILRDDLVPADLIRSVSIKEVYAPLLSLLKLYGYEEKKNLYAWCYDWRRDIRDSAAKFARFLEGVLKEQGGDIELTLLAHSMGGLVARTFLEYAEYAAHPARLLVRRLFTFGTPHLGAPQALDHIVGNRGMLWLSAGQAAKVANDPRYPATYQLLPPVEEPYCWRRTGVQDLVPAAELLKQLKPEIYQKAADWRAGLDPERLRRDGLRVFAFVSSTHRTLTSLWLNAENKFEGHDSPSSGDGTVPITSACLPRVQHYEIEGEHMDLTGEFGVQDLLPRLLGRDRLLAADAMPLKKNSSRGGAVTISLRDVMVAAGEKVRGALVLRGAALRAAEVEGTLQVAPAEAPLWPDPNDIPAPLPAQPFKVAGVRSPRLGFELNGPTRAGTYRVLLDMRYDASTVSLTAPLGVRSDA